jgi:hypothetical protein
MQGTLDDITGKKYEKLRVLSRNGSTVRGNATWNCLCECGYRCIVIGSNLRNRHTKSCGKCKTQGMRRNHPLYQTWSTMRTRCYNPKSISYPNYGARGIRVCERWRKSFKAFVDDMGPRPTPKHTLDRIDRDGDYEPSNCRWATRKQQMRNFGGNRFVEFGGRVMCATDLATRLGFRPGLLIQRLNRGWSVERAVSQPMRKRRAGNAS